MKLYRCKCGWLVSELDYMRPDWDAMCPQCGRFYSTFVAAPPIQLDRNSVVVVRRIRKKKSGHR